MKSVMLTIRLKWFYLTYKGVKTIEVRKTTPKDFVGDVYEVVSKTNFEKDLLEIPENEREFFRQFKGKVGLKFTLNKVEEIKYFEVGGNTYDFTNGFETETLLNTSLYKKSCLSYFELDLYLGDKIGYAWHISNLIIFDKPKELMQVGKKVKCDMRCPHFNGGCKYCSHLMIAKPPQSFMYIESEE